MPGQRFLPSKVLLLSPQQHTLKNPLHSPSSCGTLFLRLLLLYRLWVVKRSQGHTCGHFFVR